ncbi:MAG: 1-deoxy-D-xylulose-5-phosphate reductoisomerase [Clostridiales bacterium]|nr:1-deoxy-D-xylulose-5-phosphate reductoisomerase [Clostridiales bacterium]
MKTIAVLGSTGSIGTQTLDVVRQHRKDFRVSALSAGGNVALLEKQIREFHPMLVSVGTEAKARELQLMTADLELEITYGMEGLLAVAAQEDSEILVTAVVGMVGIRPTIAAIRAGKDIALANKETLVTAGHLIMPMAEEYGVRILPVDSEHSAIFQSWHGEKACGNTIDKILLTASGGPFRGKKREELEHVTLQDALHHPNWSMGKKVTIDSATLVNKGLEVMEAKWLFGVDLDQIQVVVHPQSVIHSMVQYADGAVIAQLGTPDMRLPIQYALCYPGRKFLNDERLDFYRLATLTFEKPDMDTFPGLRLALQAMRRGGNMPTVFNAANERAVALFLNQKIRFLEIADLIAESMEAAAYIENPDLEDILATEQAVYERMKSKGRERKQVVF